MKSTFIASISLAVLSSSACANGHPFQSLSNHEVSNAVAMDVMGTPPTLRSEYLETYLLDEDRLAKIENELGAAGLETVRRTYAMSSNQLIWTPKGANDLIVAAQKMFEHGIVAEEVCKGDIEEIALARFQSKSIDTQAKADIILTLMWTRMAQAMSGDLSEERGMMAKQGSPVLRYNLTTALTESAQGLSQTELFGMAPQAPQYSKLMSTLAEYRQIKEEGGWFIIDDGESLELDDVDPRVPQLRDRLRAEGYAVETTKPGSDPQLFDEDLTASLKTFQARHGLEDDGVLGGNTLDALNESVDSKIDRIIESMHRWRLQGDLGDRYIWANIPSYTAEAWNEGRMEIRQKTIVGKARYATPEFSDEVEYVVANPKWYLPASIVRRQKVPMLKKDPSYASKYGYRIFDRSTGEAVNASDVNWAENGVSRKYRFVQDAGDGNALGDMKIIFPNQYSVYLHGTPGKHLFNRAERAFSSGCVRLEDPVTMAQWIARQDAETKVSAIQNAIVTENNTRVDVEENVPVHITYFTVTVDDHGAPQFWRDIYDRYDGGIRYAEKNEPKEETFSLAALELAYD